MKRVRELYGFELYKIMHSKLTIAVVMILSALSIIMGLQLSKGASALKIYDEVRTFTGQVIDDELVSKMNADLVNIDGLEKEENKKYFSLAHTIWMAQEGYDLISADQYYRNRLKMQEENMEDLRMAEEEIQWWKDKEEGVQKPFAYVPTLNAKTLVEYMTNITIMAILLTAICLSGVFAGEYRRNMDQIMFSCRHGRRETFIAKILAGVTFSVSFVALFVILLTLAVWFRTGLDGLSGIVQLEIPYTAFPLTFLQFFGIQILIVIVASVMLAAMSMSLSAVFKNGVAVMGIMVGVYLLCQFINVPLKFRFISQTMNLIPTNLITMWSLGDMRLVKILGNYHTMYSVAPFAYIICAVLFIFLGSVAFKKSQH